jgi:hypothetical protein
MISWKLLGFWIVRADVVMAVSFGSLSLVRLAAAVTWTLDRSGRGDCRRRTFTLADIVASPIQAQRLRFSRAEKGLITWRR